MGQDWGKGSPAESVDRHVVVHSLVEGIPVLEPRTTVPLLLHRIFELILIIQPIPFFN